MKNPTDAMLAELVRDSMLEDEPGHKERAFDTYTHASPKVQQHIDDVLISLCGYGMDSLIKQAREVFADELDDDLEGE